MKKRLLPMLFVSVWFTLSAFATEHLPHWDLELSTDEYQSAWQKYKNEKAEGAVDPYSKKAIDAGERLQAWQKIINAERTPERQLYFEGSGAGRGIPIDAPSVYGSKQIETRWLDLQPKMPEEFKSIVLGVGKFPSDVPASMNDEEFLTVGRETIRLYQTAVRWETMAKPYLSHFAARRYMDVRGFYYLKKENDLDHKLIHFSDLALADQQRLKAHLISLCLNSQRSQSECQNSFAPADALAYKNRYWSQAQKIWDSFFKISGPRSDTAWQSTDMTMPFLTPKNQTLADFLKINVEDEFKWSNWGLKINFTPTRQFGISTMTFQRGVTPHVTGGNTIVMDENEPIESPAVKWTIRHEYGHILRLPDCYVEFYVEEDKSIVNYQLDVTDLMCSRTGRMNERIYRELERVYRR